ncbi:MAG: AtpZ/AtpI family protein [Candidatus Omnitrophica bacterium]|nr:AtpZ/AtpI family protein [Candidatus Omnitrophota bacterium]
MTKQEKKENPLAGLRVIGTVTMIPMVMVAGLMVGYFFGSWVDKTWQTGYWGKIILSFLGVVAGFKQTVRLIREVMKENNGNTKST